MFAEELRSDVHRESLNSAFDCLCRSFWSDGQTYGHLMRGPVACAWFYNPANQEKRLELQV